MYASIRQYQTTHGAAAELARRVQEGFVPIIASAPGFIAYYVVDDETTQTLQSTKPSAAKHPDGKMIGSLPGGRRRRDTRVRIEGALPNPAQRISPY
jgi:hypothetical protein